MYGYMCVCVCLSIGAKTVTPEITTNMSTQKPRRLLKRLSEACRLSTCAMRSFAFCPTHPARRTDLVAPTRNCKKAATRMPCTQSSCIISTRNENSNEGVQSMKMCKQSRDFLVRVIKYCTLVNWLLLNNAAPSGRPQPTTASIWHCDESFENKIYALHAVQKSQLARRALTAASTCKIGTVIGPLIYTASCTFPRRFG